MGVYAAYIGFLYRKKVEILFGRILSYRPELVYINR